LTKLYKCGRMRVEFAMEVRVKGEIIVMDRNRGSREVFEIDEAVNNHNSVVARYRRIYDGMRVEWLTGPVIT